MTETLYGIKDKEGNWWETPKGKMSWKKPGYAKNAWSTHNFYQKLISPLSGRAFLTYRQKRWSEFAEEEGFSIEEFSIGVPEKVYIAVDFTGVKAVFKKKEDVDEFCKFIPEKTRIEEHVVH